MANMNNNDKSRSESIGKITLALSKASMEFKTIYKSAKGYNYKYAPLENCYDATKEALAKHELCVIQTINVELNLTREPYEVLITILAHSSGEYFRSVALISPNTLNKMMNPLQNWGMALTYLRRYSYCSILGVTSEDENTDSVHQNPSKAVYVNNMVNPPKSTEDLKISETLNTLMKIIKEAKINVQDFAAYHNIKSNDLEGMTNAIANFDAMKEEYLAKEKTLGEIVKEIVEEITPSYVNNLKKNQSERLEFKTTLKGEMDSPLENKDI